MSRVGIMLAGLWWVFSATAWAQTDPAADAVKARQAAIAQSRLRTDQAKLRIAQDKLELPRPAQIPPQPAPPAGFTFQGYNTALRTVPSPASTDPLSSLQVAPGTWWNNTEMAAQLSLSRDQQKKMDDIFQQFRLKLIDLNAALSREELILDPLIASDKLDEAKILTQIDRIAQARAELEKANSRMLLGIRQSLTMEQWSKIQTSPGILRTRTLTIVK